MSLSESMDLQAVRSMTIEGENPGGNKRHLVLEDTRRDAYTKLLQQVSRSSMTIGNISTELTAQWWFTGQGFDQCCQWSARRNG